MVARRTTARTRAGRKPLPVVGRVRTAGIVPKAVRVPELNHRLSAAEVGAKLDRFEHRLYRTGRRLATAGRNSLHEVFVAGETLRRAAKGSWLALRRAVRNIGKEMSAAAEATVPGLVTLKASFRKAATRTAE